MLAVQSICSTIFFLFLWYRSIVTGCWSAGSSRSQSGVGHTHGADDTAKRFLDNASRVQELLEAVAGVSRVLQVLSDVSEFADVPQGCTLL